MTKKQKERLKQRVRQESFENVVKDLGIEKREAERYLWKLWGKEKFRRVSEQGEAGGMVVKKEKREEWARRWELKTWLRENKTALVILVVTVLVLYLPFLGNRFVSDDIFGIVDDPQIANWTHIWSVPWAFIRPLIYFVIVNLFGKIPAIFRLVNIGSHILMVGAVYLLVELLVSRRAAQITALLTAVHPIMVESVTWISGGGYSQYSVFVVLAVIGYILAKAKAERKYYYFSLVSFVIALLFSEKAMVVPEILVMYELLYGSLRRGKINDKWSQLWPFVTLAGVWIFVMIKQIAVREKILATTFSSPVNESQSWWQKISLSVSEYLGLIFWPDKLTLYHSDVAWRGLRMGMREVFLGLLLVGLILVIWRGWQGSRKWKEVSFWGSWFLISLIPTLTPWSSAWIAAERYVYLGAVGIFVLVGKEIGRYMERGRIWEKVSWGVGLVLVLGLMGRSWMRNMDWRDQDYLWLAAERTSPSSPQNQNNLGDLYSRRGDNEKALEYFQRAIEINPGYADAHHNMANIYRVLGELEEAESNYKKAAELNPGLWQSWENLASMAYQEKNYRQASEYVAKALAINPESEEVETNAAIIYWKAGEQEKATEAAEKVLRINPGNQQVRQVLEGD